MESLNTLFSNKYNWLQYKNMELICLLVHHNRSLNPVSPKCGGLKHLRYSVETLVHDSGFLLHLDKLWVILYRNSVTNLYILKIRKYRTIWPYEFFFNNDVYHTNISTYIFSETCGLSPYCNCRIIVILQECLSYSALILKIICVNLDGIVAIWFSSCKVLVCSEGISKVYKHISDI